MYFSVLNISFSSVSSFQSLSHVQLFATPWISARRASLSVTNSWSSLKLLSIELVMPSSHLILCHPLLLLPPVPPRIRVFSNESTPRMRWPKYWSFSFSISPSNEHPGLIPWENWDSTSRIASFRGFFYNSRNRFCAVWSSCHSLHPAIEDLKCAYCGQTMGSLFSIFVDVNCQR